MSNQLLSQQHKKDKHLQSILFLIAAAVVWGFAFVAQRVGGRYIPSFTFNGLRFLLGAVSLLPLIAFFDRKPDSTEKGGAVSWKAALPGGLLAGGILFVAAALQQFGILGTTAGKAGFITDLYIVIVPLLGLFWGRRLSGLTWLSIGIAVVGLYFISIRENFTMSPCDLLELAGALFWSFHILTIDHYSKKCDALKLSFIQFAFCSVLNLAAMALFERPTVHEILLGAVPLLYGGFCSVGVAYTFQTLGQRHTKPSTSAIILSLESVFSCIGGAVMLGENLGFRSYIGCTLMIAGMLLSNVKISEEGKLCLRKKNPKNACHEE